MSTVWPADGAQWTTPFFPPGKTIVPGACATGPGLIHDEASDQTRFACRVPNCVHRFSSVRLLGLHLRMGHNAFDLDHLNSAHNVNDDMRTLDGISVTASINVGGIVR